MHHPVSLATTVNNTTHIYIYISMDLLLHVRSKPLIKDIKIKNTHSRGTHSVTNDSSLVVIVAETIPPPYVCSQHSCEYHHRAVPVPRIASINTNKTRSLRSVGLLHVCPLLIAFASKHFSARRCWHSTPCWIVRSDEFHLLVFTSQLEPRQHINRWSKDSSVYQA